MVMPSSDSFDTYGGVKTDFTGIVDAQTDRSAVEVNACFASVASMTRTAARAYFQFTGTASTNVIPNFHNAVWGSAIGVIPIITRAETGVFDVAFPASVTDPLGELQPVNLVMSWGNIEGDTLAFVTVTKSTPNTLRVYLYDSSGAASDLVGTLVDIVAI